MESRQELLAALKDGRADELMEMWISGVARDRGANAEDFSKEELIDVLKGCAGTLEQ